MTTRMVIVGASGNIGTALLRRWQAETGEDRPHLVGVSRRRPAPGAPYDGVSWEELDLTDPDARPRLAAVLSGADAVVNLAWGFQPSHDIAQLERVGVGGTRVVLGAATDAGVPQVVQLSSVGAYARAERGQRVDESYPTTGVPSSPYSRHKAAAERLMDDWERDHPDGPVITRMRPGLVLQRDAGSALVRYTLPGWFPPAALRLLPVLPLDRSLTVPMVHSDDVADAIVRAVRKRAGGAFNLAAEPPVTRDDIAAVLRAHPVQVPAKLLRAVVDVSWRVHLQPLDAGWIDLAFSVPLLDTGRARRELAWAPATDARQALAELIDGMQTKASTPSPVLRRRTPVDQLRSVLERGPLTRRQRP
jgi:nucleoside-diphosphate-sugar epimerase